MMAEYLVSTNASTDNNHKLWTKYRTKDILRHWREWPKAGRNWRVFNTWKKETSLDEIHVYMVFSFGSPSLHVMRWLELSQKDTVLLTWHDTGQNSKLPEKMESEGVFPEWRDPNCAHKPSLNPWLTLNCIHTGEILRGSTESNSWKLERFKQRYQFLHSKEETELRVLVLPS